MSRPIISVRLQYEQDLVTVRQRARQVAALTGFDSQDQIRIATAVSEIARNAFQYARGGRVEFELDRSGGTLTVRVEDHGPGITNVQSILQGRYKSNTGMGLGIQGAQRLMDGFNIDTFPGRGTTVTLSKRLPRRAPGTPEAALATIAEELAKSSPQDAYDELQQQNQELVRALDELRHRQEELAQLNLELEDTNRGVVALYAELDERAEHLKRADQLKSTFLSHMSHEFRTPLNSIMALSQILLSHLDGPLNAEQEKQVSFIHRAAQELTDLVNDLLDLAKVEAGKVEVHPTQWSLQTLVGTLRGMMKPLVANSPVQLVIEDAIGVPELYTDESKVAQILRNFVSNAIKFTERGEVRVTSRYEDASPLVRISVSDTGIGIAPEHQSRIFDQYVQLQSERQRKVRGTGLGLPLSRKLAELLGGSITLASSPGQGSTFTLELPLRYAVDQAQEEPAPPVPARSAAPAVPQLLVVDDEDIARYLVRKHIGVFTAELIEARNGEEGLRVAREVHPDLVILDLVMPGLDGFEVLEQLKSAADTKDIPVIIHTSKTLRSADRERIGNSAFAIVSKAPGHESDLRDAVKRVLGVALQHP